MRDLQDQMDDLDHELADKQRQEKQLTSVHRRLPGEARRRSRAGIGPRRIDERPRDAADDLSEPAREARRVEAGSEPRATEQRRTIPRPRSRESAGAPVQPQRDDDHARRSGGGLALGVLVVGFLVYGDSSFKSEDDVMRLCQLPVLAQVPLMASPAEHRATKRRAILINGLAVVVVLASSALVAASTLHVF